LKEGTHFSKESVTDMIYREMREYGTSLVCFDQHISKLSDTVRGNSACHIAFQQQLPQDIFEISGIMQLREKKEFFSMLPVGTAIVTLSERYTAPFLVEVESVKLREKEITDANIRDRMKAIIMGRDYDLGVDPEFNKDLVSGGKKDVEKKKDKEDVHLPIKTLFNIEDFLGKDVGGIGKISEQVLTPKGVPSSTKKEYLSEEGNLTPVQQILYDFVRRKLRDGIDLLELERMMDRNVQYGDYSAFDVLKVINYALENQLKEVGSVTIPEKQNFYKAENSSVGNQLNQEQEMFLSFLREHPAHDCSTVELYKLMGFSPRKGNKIKEELLKKNMVKIDEQKNQKGWRKVINLK